MQFIEIQKFQKKPHRNIEKKFRNQLLVHIAMICFIKVKRLDNFDKNYVSMWLKNKKDNYTQRVTC